MGDFCSLSFSLAPFLFVAVTRCVTAHVRVSSSNAPSLRACCMRYSRADSSSTSSSVYGSLKFWGTMTSDPIMEKRNPLATGIPRQFLGPGVVKTYPPRVSRSLPCACVCVCVFGASYRWEGRHPMQAGLKLRLTRLSSAFPIPSKKELGACMVVMKTEESDIFPFSPFLSAAKPGVTLDEGKHNSPIILHLHRYASRVRLIASSANDRKKDARFVPALRWAGDGER